MGVSSGYILFTWWPDCKSDWVEMDSVPWGYWIPNLCVSDVGRRWLWEHILLNGSGIQCRIIYK